MIHPGSNLEKFNAAVSILAWMVLSSVVILFNKWILNAFPFSITLTTWHMLCATFATRVLACTTSLIDTKTHLDMKTYLTAFLPIGFCFSMSLILSNMTYIYLTMSFIQMLKALGPVATLLACWSMGLRNPAPSFRVFFVVLTIVGGVMLASFGEVQFVLLGFMIQLAAVAFEAYKNALQQSLLSGKLNMSTMTLLYYFAPICVVTNSFFIYIFEWEHVVTWRQNVQPWQLQELNMGIFFLNGVTTFALNIASVNVIKQTSSLVLTLAGIPKAMILMGLDMYMFNCPLSLMQAIGFTIAGTGTYRYSQLKESVREAGSKGATKWQDEKRPVGKDEEDCADELSLEFNEKRGSYLD
ncbi:triose-phosphate transporter [Phlyctema vagabunda]|uniref:Triose-phosphate transporter n=1 Tax=Phlyctema vagabunda TaxID=108571 RepID=A0ABR4P9R9_9HELO